MGRRAFVEQIMGLPVSLHFRGDAADDPPAARAAAAVFAELREVDALFSTYRPDSEISRLRRGELRLDRADPLVRAVAHLCERARERTEGYFDAHLPGGYDPSGLVKGWAVERAAAHLRALDDLDFCLNAGGDIVVRGPWRIGVEDPEQPQRILTGFPVTDAAVATSGNAHRGTHIIHPNTGAPARELHAVTVRGPSLTWADVYATAAVARGPQAVVWLAGLDGYEALLVDAEGRLFATPGWAVDTGPIAATAIRDTSGLCGS
jgi:thiamine biosynthesis lipoprotein